MHERFRVVCAYQRGRTSRGVLKEAHATLASALQALEEHQQKQDPATGRPRWDWITVGPTVQGKSQEQLTLL